MLDGVGESGDKARMHAQRDIRWASRPAVPGMAAGTVARVLTTMPIAARAAVQAWRAIIESHPDAQKPAPIERADPGAV